MGAAYRCGWLALGRLRVLYRRAKRLKFLNSRELLCRYALKVMPANAPRLQEQFLQLYSMMTTLCTSTARLYFLSTTHLLTRVVAAKPGAPTDEEWGKSFMSPGAFVALVYQGV